MKDRVSTALIAVLVVAAIGVVVLGIRRQGHSGSGSITGNSLPVARAAEPPRGAKGADGAASGDDSGASADVPLPMQRAATAAKLHASDGTEITFCDRQGPRDVICELSDEHPWGDTCRRRVYVRQPTSQPQVQTRLGRSHCWSREDPTDRFVANDASDGYETPEDAP